MSTKAVWSFVAVLAVIIGIFAIVRLRGDDVGTADAEAVLEVTADDPSATASPAPEPVQTPTTEAAAEASETPGTTPTPDPTAEADADVDADPTPEGRDPTETAAGGRSFTLAFSGDVLVHSGVYNQAAAFGGGELAYDFRPMFRRVQPAIEDADLAVCHLETPLSPDNTALSGYPLFNTPRDLADSLVAVGYDGCSTASNHSIDQFGEGVDSTLDQLDRVGLGHAGMARTEAEAGRPRLYEVAGATVGHLSYTYGLNGLVPPADRPWIVDVTEVDAVLAEASAAKAAGADMVVLSIQWGNEYQTAPTDIQREQARVFLGSPDIDLIIGSHVHVIQPVDMVGGEYVVYGLGNFVSNQAASTCTPCPAGTQDGLIVFADVVEEAPGDFVVQSLRLTPTYVDRTDYTILPVAAAIDDPSTPDWLRNELIASWERTYPVVLDAAPPGVTPTELWSGAGAP